MHDVIIKNGFLIDGTGSPWFRADISIEGERIAEIGDLKSAEARETIDATGLIVSPGLIDTHNHSDFSIVIDGKAQSMVRQGVTTVVQGNCGSSPAPVKDPEELRIRARALYQPDWKWRTLGEYFDRLESQGISLNVIQIVGHSNIRVYVMGYEDRQPTKKELEEMKELLTNAMEEGAVGISTGLIYIPSCFSDTDELVELSKVIAKYNGIYATHERTLGEEMFDAVKEAIEIGERAGVSVVVSHMNPAPPLYGRVNEMVKMIEDARSRGVDVTADSVVYTVGQTGLLALLPNWARDGGIDKIIERLSSKETREKIKQDTLKYGAKTGGSGKRYLAQSGRWNKLWLDGTLKNTDLNGKSFEEVARIRNQDHFDAYFDLIIEERGHGSVLGEDKSQEDLDYLMQHPLIIPESDGIALAPYGVLGEGKSNPRSYGWAAHILGRYVRERGILRLEEDIRKLTSYPASRFKIKGRGLLKEGMYADILVFDADRIIDKATLDDPYQYPDGIEYVIVNGQVVVERGEHTGALPGKILKYKP